MNSHRTLAALLFTMTGCLLAALASAAPFSSPGGYTITPPPSWGVASNQDAGKDVMMVEHNISAATGTPNLIIKVLPNQNSTSLAALKQALNPYYKKAFPGMVVVSQKSGSLSGVQDLDTVYTKPQSGQLMRVRQIYALRNGTMYIFNFAYPQKIHVKYDAVAAKMLASVRWK